MKISDKGLAIIKEFESYMRELPNGDCVAYRCIVGHKNGKPVYDGKWTIGWGCTEGIKEGMVWTRQQAEDGLRRELEKTEQAVTRHVTVDLNQNQFDALSAFEYNIGEGGFASSSVLRYTNQGNFAAAARVFGLWVNSNGVRNVPGLVRRRAQESALFLEPVAMHEPAMPQTVDAPDAAPVGSRKVATANVGQGVGALGAISLLGVSTSESLGYAQQLAGFIKGYGVPMAIGLLIAVTVAFALIRHWTNQDHAEGRYTPSGG